MSKPNFILMTDSYKLTHASQYPAGTQKVFSYMESRGGEFPETVFFGLQYYLRKYLSGKVLTQAMIDKADAFCSKHFGRNLYNRSGWELMLERYDGRIPVEIRAVPEGTVQTTRNVMMTIVNTDEEFPWITNAIETLLLKLWYPITVSTLSREIKKEIKARLDATGDMAGLPFKLHDFGYRGVSSEESAGIGGAAHLVNFMGTDTIAGILLADKHYGAGVCGFSIPASEHSTMTSWGREREVDAYRNMLTRYPSGLVACVSDSYDIYNACENIWGGVLREQVLARDGTLVIRPDSGDPLEVLPRILNILWDRFGGTINEKGFRVLDSHVRVIWGDGINYRSIQGILDCLYTLGWSIDNIAFGMGGALLQQVHRDTQKFAFKCSAVKVNGHWCDVWKDPVTDHGKDSKRGLLWYSKGKTRNVSIEDKYRPGRDFPVVFRDGKICRKVTFQEIRERAEI